MDSGCVKPGDEFEELFDVSRALDPQEVLGVMDQLLCHEVGSLSKLASSLVSHLFRCPGT